MFFHYYKLHIFFVALRFSNPLSGSSSVPDCKKGLNMYPIKHVFLLTNHQLIYIFVRHTHFYLNQHHRCNVVFEEIGILHNDYSPINFLLMFRYKVTL